MSLVTEDMLTIEPPPRTRTVAYAHGRDLVSQPPQQTLQVDGDQRVEDLIGDSAIKPVASMPASFTTVKAAVGLRRGLRSQIRSMAYKYRRVSEPHE
jgi:hypothetical protein